jgi:hypothetical protein
VDLVRDLLGLRGRAGRLGVAVLDERVMLGMPERQLRHSAFRVQDAELELLVPDDRGAVGAALDPNARPRVELVGDLVDQGVCS